MQWKSPTRTKHLSHLLVSMILQSKCQHNQVVPFHYWRTRLDCLSPWWIHSSSMGGTAGQWMMQFRCQSMASTHVWSRGLDYSMAEKLRFQIMAEFSHLQEWVTLYAKLSSQHVFHLCASGYFVCRRAHVDWVFSFSTMGNFVCQAVFSTSISSLCKWVLCKWEEKSWLNIPIFKNGLFCMPGCLINIFSSVCKWVLCKWEGKSWLNFLIFNNK